MLALTSKISGSHKTAQTLGLQISFFIAQKCYKEKKIICENKHQAFAAFLICVRLSWHKICKYPKEDKCS